MRKARELQDGASYHVIIRVNRGEMIFSPDQYKALFILVVRKGKKIYKFILENFCIMGNHIHFMIKPAKGANLSKIMQWILSTFAMRYNRMTNQKGHIFYDRFKSKIINDYRQYWATHKYIAYNPVKARIVESPVDYEYNGITFMQKGIIDLFVYT